jgi:hypothetical protein
VQKADGIGNGERSHLAVLVQMSAERQLQQNSLQLSAFADEAPLNKAIQSLGSDPDEPPG